MTESGIALGIIGSVVALLGVATGGIWKTLGSYKNDLDKLDRSKVGHNECDAIHKGITNRIEDVKETINNRTNRIENKVDRLIEMNGGRKKA